MNGRRSGKRKGRHSRSDSEYFYDLVGIEGGERSEVVKHVEGGVCLQALEHLSRASVKGMHVCVCVSVSVSERGR